MLSLTLLMASCADDDAKRRAETLRSEKHNDSVLKMLGNNWRFDVQDVTPNVTRRVSTWNEWQQFKSELEQKPAGTLSAYRQKTKSLVKRADDLRNNIPLFFDKPQVRSRIGVLITKIKSLHTYVNIDAIPEARIRQLTGEIAKETNSLQNQLDELIRISEIPREMGEEEMLRALDTVRMANPDIQPQPATTPATPMPPRRRPQIITPAN